MNNPSGDKGRGRMLREVESAKRLLGGGSTRGVGASYDPWTDTVIDYAVPYRPQVFMHPTQYGVGARLPAPPSRRIAASATTRGVTCLPGFTPHFNGYRWVCYNDRPLAKPKR